MAACARSSCLDLLPPCAGNPLPFCTGERLPLNNCFTTGPCPRAFPPPPPIGQLPTDGFIKEFDVDLIGFLSPIKVQYIHLERENVQYLVLVMIEE